MALSAPLGAGPTLALERRLPGLTGRLSRVVLTMLPTRVHRLAALGGELGVEELWIKRDDESGGLYGGNKPRKLEFLLGDALARRRSAVLTFGGIGTHHGLATAVYARSVGLKAILMLVRQPVTAAVRRSLLLDLAAGAELHYAPTVARLALRTLGVYARRLRRGEPPYVIPTGGSSPLGVLGYVNAACELQEQIAAGELPEPAAIFVPLGSGGTAAGLALGLKLAGVRARVVAVLVTDILPPSTVALERLQRRTLALLRRAAHGVPAVAIGPHDLTIVHGYVGDGYGAPTAAGNAARDRLREREGIVLDTTYSAKCFAALCDALRRPEYRAAPVLFWNTFSSVDPEAGLGPLPDYRQLPAAFHEFFRGEIVES